MMLLAACWLAACSYPRQVHVHSAAFSALDVGQRGHFVHLSGCSDRRVLGRLA